MTILQGYVPHFGIDLWVSVEMVLELGSNSGFLYIVMV